LFGWQSLTYTFLYALNVLADVVAFYIIVRRYATWMNLVICGIFWVVMGGWAFESLWISHREPILATFEGAGVVLVEGVLRMTLAMALGFGAAYSTRRHTLGILIFLWLFLGLEDFALVLHPHSSLMWGNVNYWLSYVLCIGAFGWIAATVP
jgi:hypothetical protein